MADKRFVVSKDMMTTELNITIENEKVADAAALRGLNNRINSLETGRVTGVKGNAETQYRIGYVNLTPANLGAIASSDKGASGGVAELDNSGHVPSSQLPSYDIVKQTITNSTNADYRVLMSVTANDTTKTEGARKNANLKYNPSTDTLFAKKVSGVVYNQLLTGTGTAGEDKGSDVTPRYFPSKWTFDTGRTPADGDVITIKIPVDGITYGDYLSIDNGTAYKPVALYGTTRLTTQFAADMYIRLIYDANASVASIYNVNGGDASETVTGGAWRVINYYDTNTTYTPQKLGFGYGTCDTAEATAAKEATLTDYTLVKNGIVSIKFTYAVSANATLNINSKGAKAIYYKGAKITAGIIPAGAIATFIYSTYYHLIALDTGGTGGGHTILNSFGTSMTQREKLQFSGMNVLDDSTNNKTIVKGQLVKVTQEQYNALTTAQKNDANTTYEITDTDTVLSLPSATLTISSTGWSNSTTTVDGTAYYTYEVALSSVFDSHPDIYLRALSIFPSLAEKQAYMSVDYITVDTDTSKLKCYARSKPSANFVIIVKGVSV